MVLTVAMAMLLASPIIAQTAPGAQGAQGAAGAAAQVAVPIDGGIVYGAALAYASTAAGTTGQCITSNGANAPTWGACGAAWNGVFSAYYHPCLNCGAFEAPRTWAAMDVASAGRTGNLYFTTALASGTGTATLAVERGDGGVFCTASLDCASTTSSNFACDGGSFSAGERLLFVWTASCNTSQLPNGNAVLQFTE